MELNLDDDSMLGLGEGFDDGSADDFFDRQRDSYHDIVLYGSEIGRLEGLLYGFRWDSLDGPDDVMSDGSNDEI